MQCEPCEPDAQIAADPIRFKQILYNLLSNAIKFTPQGVVTVRCQWVERADRQAGPAAEPNARALRVEVIDTGIGIAPKDQERIWEEFRQFPLAAQQVGLLPGTGLGLALTRRLVQHMGGDVWVDSAPRPGQHFWLRLAPEGARVADSPPRWPWLRRRAATVRDARALRSLMTSIAIPCRRPCGE